MLELLNVSKRYGEHTVIDNISLQLAPHRVYGLLGVNGTGKSTLLNMITGCLPMSDGNILVSGLNIVEDALNAKRKIGYLPEIPPLYPDMSCREYLEFVAEAKRIEKSEAAKQIDEVMELLSLNDVSGRLIQYLSKGYKQRIGIAQAILSKPELLIFDEPTVGLDPKQIADVRNLFQSLGKESTVILSSHILSEVSAVCDELIILNKGKIVAFDTPEGLQEKYGNTSFVKLHAKCDEGELRSLLSAIPGLDISSSVNKSNITEIIAIYSSHSNITEKIFSICARGGIPVLHLSQESTNLEDIFFFLTGQEVVR